ncbi:MAG: arginine repressor [Clostridiales bacterium]|nr:arginine repressor [Clostridiales bacterium]MDY2835376.1 arginine repressor [Candidatus Aphodomonas sp.]
MKRQRHRMILEIIENQAIETQEALSEALRKYGFDVTQATVSRDIKELRLFKVMGDDGVYRYAVAERSEQGLTERLRRVFAETVQSVDYACNQIVIKTLPGGAHAAAEMVDTMRWKEVVGTLAGDNTILVILRTVEDAPEVVERFKGMMK